PFAPILRPVRDTDAGEIRRTSARVPQLRAGPLSAYSAGRNGIGATWRPPLARAFPPLRPGHVQRVGWLRRARREPRALPSTRSERGGRCQGCQSALLLEPVLALPPFAHDR